MDRSGSTWIASGSTRIAQVPPLADQTLQADSKRTVPSIPLTVMPLRSTSVRPSDFHPASQPASTSFAPIGGSTAGAASSKSPQSIGNGRALQRVLGSASILSPDSDDVSGSGSLDRSAPLNISRYATVDGLQACRVRIRRSDGLPK